MQKKLMIYTKLMLKKLCIVFIYMYKWILSPVLPKSCRFLPSCSDYALEAIDKHGVLGGSYLTIKRISNCHPFGGHGIDMVPKQITTKRKKCQN